MNNPAAHTPLESLLLFQSLLVYGVDDGAFAHVSELLKNSVLIKGSGSYDPTRLSPDALRRLFLFFLRDETEAVASEGPATDGPGALQDMVLGALDKIPALVDRLYQHYKDGMVKQIVEDEQRFAHVQREIQLLERSEKERLARAASQSGTPALTSRDAKGATTVPAVPAAVRRGAGANTPVLPPKTPTPGAVIAAPKVAPPPGPASQRPAASPKPPVGVASVLQAPPGAPTQPGSRVLQPPAQPKQITSPRPESAAAAPPLKDVAAPQPSAGVLKWEKPYQPPPAIQAPQAGQFAPMIPPGQKAQPQAQWLQQQAHAKSLSPAQQQQQQQQPQYAPQHGQQMQQPSPPPPQARSAPPIKQAPLAPPQQPAAAAAAAAQLVPPFQQGPPRPVGSTVAPQARPPSTTQGRLIQPQQGPQAFQNQRSQPVQQPQGATHPQQAHVQQVQKPLSQLAQKFQQQKSPAPRPLAVATPVKGGSSAPAAGARTPGSATPQRWPQQGQHASPSPAPPAGASKDGKSYASPYAGQQPRPAIPEHMIRQAVTPGPGRRVMTPAPPALRTPGPASGSMALKRGFGTKWATHTTPSTPDPTVSEPQSPAFEPVSPPQRPTAPWAVSGRAGSKPGLAAATPVAKGRGRPPRTAQGARGGSATPSASGTRRSQSVASQTDELSLDHSMPVPTPKMVKKEAGTGPTPRVREETGDTTADESVYGRGGGILMTPGSVSRVPKRKRQEAPESWGPPTHVLWTRGFTKVSSSALDQISSHRDANMFATALRERDAPNYRQIVLQPQDITSIRSAIKQGNKAAQQAANNLAGGDPGTAAVWLPLSDDLVPPRGIINSAHLERELVHMFCNAIMYNPDPDRGPGPAFLKRSQSDEEEIFGYCLDENGVVKNTQSMFVEVEKLLGDLRAAEKDRGIPPTSGTTRQGSDDTAEEEDELAADGDSVSVPGTVKRRRISTRG